MHMEALGELTTRTLSFFVSNSKKKAIKNEKQYTAYIFLVHFIANLSS